MDILDLERLYAQIPTFKCIPGCTDCCGPVPFARIEWDRISDQRAATGIKCPYANCGCDIYAQRPLVCRIFGTVDDKKIECPHGCRPPFLLRPEAAHVILMEYVKKFIGGFENG